jgi:hypothetical protein
MITASDLGDHREEGSDLRPDPFDTGEVLRVSLEDRRKTSEPLHEAMRGRVSIAARNDMKEQQLQDLMVLEAIEPLLQKACPQTLAMSRMDLHGITRWPHRQSLAPDPIGRCSSYHKASTADTTPRSGVPHLGDSTRTMGAELSAKDSVERRRDDRQHPADGR